MATPTNHFDRDTFLTWFESAGGWYSKSLDLVQTPGMGFGAIAVEDIPADAPVFTIPDTMIMSPLNSDIKKHLAEEEWDKLAGGWSQLIITMMWETARGIESPWHTYLSNMPTTFDTPMFWNTNERNFLRGTDIEDRIGREDAEAVYFNILVPAHPELFPPQSPHTTLSAFHLQGSRILSRSFTVPVTRLTRPFEPHAERESESGSEDSEEDDSVVVMIPFADMLNAAHQRDNVHLFTDGEASLNQTGVFTMKSTKDIRKSEQIYNTYDSPPNSELLRKYGHIDVLPLSADYLGLLEPGEIGGWPYGNPSDEVVLQGSDVLKAVSEYLCKEASECWEASMQPRIDWWIEEDEDEVFPLTVPYKVDDALVSFTRLFLYDKEWTKAEKKGRVPTPHIDPAVIAVLLRAIELRSAKYDSSMDEDLMIVMGYTEGTLPTDKVPVREGLKADSHKFYAAGVRLGERRILSIASRVIAACAVTGNKKRKGSVLEK
ncbi:hypothetical protein IAT38_004762 [Cryptococcus sp. DSM 104549]